MARRQTSAPKTWRPAALVAHFLITKACHPEREPTTGNRASIDQIQSPFVFSEEAWPTTFSRSIKYFPPQNL
jgi:hypothetical protein